MHVHKNISTAAKLKGVKKKVTELAEQLRSAEL